MVVAAATKSAPTDFFLLFLQNTAIFGIYSSIERGLVIGLDVIILLAPFSPPNVDEVRQLVIRRKNIFLAVVLALESVERCGFLVGIISQQRHVV